MEHLLVKKFANKKYKHNLNLPKGESQLKSCENAIKDQLEREKSLVRVQVDNNTTYLVKPEDVESIKIRHANKVREKYLSNNFHRMR